MIDQQLHRFAGLQGIETAEDSRVVFARRQLAQVEGVVVGVANV
jgi:hypothetical protein